MDFLGDQGSRHVRESGFWNPGNLCLWNPESGKFCESGLLAFEIRSAAQRIRNATNDWNLQSIQVSLKKNPKSTARNPESRTVDVLDSLTRCLDRW